MAGAFFFLVEDLARKGGGLGRMDDIRPGDIVARVSHGKDVLFRVREIKTAGGELGWTAVLVGLEFRLMADAPLEDLEVQQADAVLAYRHTMIAQSASCMRRIQMRRRLEWAERYSGTDLARGGDGDRFFEVPGRVLHLDGDGEYMKKCLHAYGQFDIQVTGFHVPEDQQPQMVVKYVEEFNPDILVLTGHDGLLRKQGDFKDLDNYRTSRYFVQAVRTIRRSRSSRDSLVIFAGACQSHYEALLQAGANFASSPQRVLIHAYDPVYVVERVAFTPINESIQVEAAVGNTITGMEGIGGVETKGRFRRGYPRSPY